MRITRSLAVGILCLLITFILCDSFYEQRNPLLITQDVMKVFVKSTILLGVSVYDPVFVTPVRTSLADESKTDVTLPSEIMRFEDFCVSMPLPDKQRIECLKVDNQRIIKGDYPFIYQSLRDPRLARLRERYHLGEIVASSSCEFESQVKLRSWARSQFRRKDYQSASALKAFDAFALLEASAKNETDRPYDPAIDMDPCVFFPLLCSQVLASVGYQSRLVGINHGALEVWSNQYCKWVFFDAELNWHFERDDIPQSMFDLYQAYRREEGDDVQVVLGTQTSEPNTTQAHLNVETIPTPVLLTWFKEFSIASMRNNWLTDGYFKGHPSVSDSNTLMFAESASKPFRIREVLVPRSSKRTDFNWTLNQAEIWVRNPGSRFETLGFVFKTFTPDIDFFELKINGETRQHRSEAFRWKLRKGLNRFTICPVNQLGVRGVSSTIEFIFHEP